MGASTISPADWQTLQLAPLWVFYLVAGADQKIDDAEKLALIQLVTGEQRPSDPISKTVLSSMERDLGAIIRLLGQDRRDPVTGLRQTADCLGRVASGTDARAYKNTLLTLGRHVAEASPIEADETAAISAEEHGALLLIAQVLGLLQGDVGEWAGEPVTGALDPR